MLVLAGCVLVVLSALTAAVIGGATITFGPCGFIASTCFMAIVWILYLDMGKKGAKNG